MYFTTYSPLPIVIVNTVVIIWCILANLGGELLTVINIKSSNDGGHQISFTSFKKTSCLKK